MNLKKWIKKSKLNSLTKSDAIYKKLSSNNCYMHNVCLVDGLIFDRNSVFEL